ncbi:MAG TPA: FHA domain-containing protein, partial [Planctomycetaceae bacterium]|nr:FHA domain-containing protein [Planctomycetaceae bacterium]
MNQEEDIQGFAAACDAQLPLRLQVTDERSGESEEVLVDRPFALVGSSEMCDVRLAHPDVSRCHAYLQSLQGRILCCDLGSRTGTHWGPEIRSRSFLETGQPLHIGPYSLRLVDNEFVDPPSDEFPAALEPRRPPRAPQLNIALTFLNARNRTGRSRISSVRNPVTLVGWSHLCHLRLQHRSVGRVHCSLVWTSGGMWVVDLMCRGGTRVNGELINFARLSDGDEMELGRFQLKIGFGSSGEMPVYSPEDLPESSPVSQFPRAMTYDAVNDDDPASGPAGRSLPAPPSSKPQQLPVARIESLPELTDLRQATPPLPAPAPPDVSSIAVNDPTAVTLMQQFAVMQQQMFDHTYQLLAVVTEAFQTAHNRQLQLIREELMRVHELNRELYDLNRQRGTVDTAPEAAIVAGASPLPGIDELQRKILQDMPSHSPAVPPSADAVPPETTQRT